jgi:hypothetical protein
MLFLSTILISFAVAGGVGTMGVGSLHSDIGSQNFKKKLHIIGSQETM